MPTRSGKPYQDHKKKKQNQDVILNTAPTPGKDTAINIIASTMSCSRDVRIRKTTRKRAISVSNVDIENATDSNWIIADVSHNKTETQDSADNCSMTSNTDYQLETKYVSAKKNLRRKSCVCGDIKTIKSKKHKVKNVTGVNDVERDSEETNASKRIELDKGNGYQNNVEENYQEDTENDINNANVITKQIKNKKKIKNSKKKKQRKRLSPYKIDNLNDINGIQINNGNTDVNISLSANEYIEKRHSNIKDITFDKEETSITKHHKTKSPNNSFKNVNNDKEFNLNSPNIKRNLNPKRKSSIINSALDQNNILDTTYDKDERHDTAKESRNNSTLQLNDSNGAINSLKMNTPAKQKNTLSGEINSINNAFLKSNLETNTPNISPMSLKRKKSDIKNSTFEIQDETGDITPSKNNNFNRSNRLSRINTEDLDILNVSNTQLCKEKTNIIDTTFDKDDINTTYIKDGNPVAISSVKDGEKSGSKINVSGSKRRLTDLSDKDKIQSFDAFKKGVATRKSSIKDETFDKVHSSIESPTRENIAKEHTLSSSTSKRKSIRRHTIDVNNSVSIKLDSTFDVTPDAEVAVKPISRKSTVPFQETINTTFDKDIESSSKSSLISSDNSDVYKNYIPRISITSDESNENIADTTPIYIASSMEESNFTEDLKNSTLTMQTPMKREGTFTKNGPEIQTKSSKTPERSVLLEMPQAGCTPYHVAKSSQKPMLNITRSLEKKTSIETAPRLTRVMFCSPVDNQTVLAQEKNKIIKSSIKGSNKSFVFDEDAAISRPGRKRSFTNNDADNTIAKRSRLDTQQKSIDKKIRARANSATGKLTSVTPKKTTPKCLPKTRSRLPNFAALHQKQFEKMESLSDYKERKALRARQMLTPSGAKEMLERISPKNDVEQPKTVSKEPAKDKDKAGTPSKKQPTQHSTKPVYTRFGFKLNMDFNPFSVPPKTDKPKELPKTMQPITLPSLKGATLSKHRENSFSRREAAKQAVMREKSFVEKRTMDRKENRTIIKGVRTNRRFELQMKFRNVE